MIRNGHVLVAQRAAGLDHVFDGVHSVGRGRVHVEVAADVFEADEIRQLAFGRGRNLPPVLAELRGDPR